jgi:integrase
LGNTMDTQSSVFKRGPRTKKAKLKDGSTKEYLIKGGWYYRLRYVDQDGRPCTDEKGPYARKSEAKDAMNASRVGAEKSGGRKRQSTRMTFSELCDICEKELFHEAKFVTGADGNLERVSGIKSWKTVRAQVARLKAFFGSRLVSSITTKSLADYKEDRRNQYRANKDEKKRRHITQTTVNRELATMRRMMRHALRAGWVTNDVFAGARVIETSKEVARQRVLSRAEESALLAACKGEWDREYTRKINGVERTVNATFAIDNQHLKAVIMLALDTGMRRGEILKLRWRDIDFNSGVITVVGTHTKTERERKVPLSERVATALKELQPSCKSEGPFPYSDMKRAFATAKRLSGINDLRFHDLRTTAGDRMAKVYPLTTVSKILGHAQYQTTLKFYVGNEVDTILEVKKWLDQKLPQPIADSTSETIH